MELSCFSPQAYSPQPHPPPEAPNFDMNFHAKILESDRDMAVIYLGYD